MSDVALTRGVHHSGVYANFAHGHSAANITSGTLSTARFDAYADLGASGRLDNNTTGDLLTRTQLDARYEPKVEGSFRIQIPVSKFALYHPQQEDDTWYSTTAAGAIVGGFGTLDVDLIASVEVPHSATFDSFECYLYDNTAGADIAEFDATLRALGNGYQYSVIGTISDVTTSGANNALLTRFASEPPGAALDRDLSYSVIVKMRTTGLPPNYTFLSLRGCRINYTR